MRRQQEAAEAVEGREMKSRTSINVMTRRHLLALGGAGLLAAGLGARAFAAAPAEVAVQLNWLETADFAAAFAAEQQGFDAAAGVKQVFIPGGPQVDAVQSVAGGSALVGFGGAITQIALARASGIPIKLIGSVFRASPVGLISLADKPIKTPKDAVGKRIGLQGGAQLPWSIILKENGLSEDQMTIVPVAGDITPLVSRQIDGYWGTAVNQHIALKLKGIDNHIMTRDNIGAPEHFLVIFAMEESIQKRGDDIVNWLKALKQGEEYAIANAAAVADYVVKRSPALQLNPEQQRLQAQAAIEFVNPVGRKLPLLRVDEEGASKAISQVDGMGMLPRKMPLAELLDNSLLDRVYA